MAFCFRSACRARPILARRSAAVSGSGTSRINGLTAAGACGGGERPSAGFAGDNLAPLRLQNCRGFARRRRGPSRYRLSFSGDSQAEGSPWSPRTRACGSSYGALQRRNPQLRLRTVDRQCWICATRWFAGWRKSPLIVKLDTVPRWHRR
jgi:hypothetical protein